MSFLSEGRLDVKLLTIWLWTTEKAEVGRIREGKRRKKIKEERKSKKKEDANARQGRTVVKRCVFLMFCGPWGPATAAGAKIAQRCGVKHVSKSNC